MDSQPGIANKRPDVVLDLPRLRKNCNGNPEIVSELLEHLQQTSGPKWMAALKDGLQTADSKKLREVSHGMKGAAATVFAWRISIIALEFEALARAGKVEELRERMVELEEAFRELKEWLARNL